MNSSEELKKWLSDLNLLKDWVDPGNIDRSEFNDAFEVALKKAKLAAIKYIKDNK